MKKVRIGALDYDIKYVANPLSGGSIANGVINDDRQMITIDSNLPPQYKAYALWHEITHAMFFSLGIFKGQEIAIDERLIDSLANTILQVIRDNPKLAKIHK